MSLNWFYVFSTKLELELNFSKIGAKYLLLHVLKDVGVYEFQQV